MAEMEKGKSCGACHDDRTAFTVKANCSRCHPVRDIPYVLDAWFGHNRHLQMYTCTDCHNAFFSASPGNKRRTMVDMEKDQSCGACHDGYIAFSVAGDCNSDYDIYLGPVVGGIVDLSSFPYLQVTLHRFWGSFARRSLAVHGGYNVAYMNQNPHYGVPLDALRGLEAEGAIGPGKLYPAYYVIPGNQGSPAVMRRTFSAKALVRPLRPSTSETAIACPFSRVRSRHNLAITIGSGARKTAS